MHTARRTAARSEDRPVTMRTEDAASAFLAARRIAVTGVSRTPRRHGGEAVYRRLRERGYDVVPVNPFTDRIGEDPCYPDLRSIPNGVDVVVIATRPERAADIVREAAAIGVRIVWMHRSLGPGSLDPDAAALGRSRGMTVIDGGCPLMYAPVSDPGHRLLCRCLKVTGTIPRAV